MIHVDRSVVPIPAVLQSPKATAALKLAQEHFNPPKKRPGKYEFNERLYGHSEVVVSTNNSIEQRRC